MDLSKLQIVSKEKKPKRVGRGSGSGHGKTSGRGHKGTGQRKGRKYYVGFNGGNLPFYRRLPKVGFNPFRKVEYQIVNLKDIGERLSEAKEITPTELKGVNLIKSVNKPVKILAKGKEKFEVKGVLFKAHKFSREAQRIIENLGGKIECLPL